MEITQELMEFIGTNMTDMVGLTGYFICAGFVLSTLLSLLGYGIFKALALVNIINK